MDASKDEEMEMDVPAGIPPAGMRACMGAVSKIWRMSGPDFVFEQLGDATALVQGDLLLTVVFHLKDKPRLIELDDEHLEVPELCASFLLSVADHDDFDEVQEEVEKEVDLLHFSDSGEMAAQPDCTAEGQGEPRSRPVVFELFGDGSASSDQQGIQWSFISPEAEALQQLRIIGSAMFRHRYTEEETLAAFNRVDCVERCRVLNSIDMPFPEAVVDKNLDLLANMLMLGLVPVTVPEDLAQCLDSRDLTRGIVTQEQMDAKIDRGRRLKMTKKSVFDSALRLKPLHRIFTSGAHHTLRHGLRIGHLGILIETGVVVGGAGMLCFFV